MAEPTWAHSPPRTILLATDLSNRCDRALDRAADLAKGWGARLVVVHALDPEHYRAERQRQEALPSWRRPPDPSAAAAARIRRDLALELEGVEVRVGEGEPGAVIEEVARETGAGLIVTGVARDEALGRTLLGSTVERLARRSPVPVLVVRSRLRPYREVLVATDFSPSSRHALVAAATFFPTAPLTLLHAWEVPFAGFLDQGNFREQYRAEQQKACDDFVAAAGLSPLQLAGLQVLLEHGDPEALVRDYMIERDVDLVVVGTHGRSAMFDVLIGGVAKRILEFAPGDVLLVREPRAAPGR